MFFISRHLMVAAAFCGATLAPLPALAASATASQNVNVRSGPATSYGVVARLNQGDSVDVRQCEGQFCQISFGGQTGWVSATYLTRDFVPKAPASQPQIATTVTGSSPTLSQDLPPPAQTTPSAVPQIASTQPKTPAAHGSMALPLGTFPPAYDEDAGSSASSADTANVNDTPNDGDPGLGDNNQPTSSVHLPDDSGEVVASTGNAPRPKADVPNVNRSSSDDDIDLGSADDNSPDALSLPDEGTFTRPDPTYDDRFGSGSGRYGRFGHGGWRGRFAEGPTGGGQACFFTGRDNLDGFCLRAGQSVRDLGAWADRIVAIRNPRGLLVTVCSTLASDDCHVYDSTGPLRGHDGIASISVAVPGY